MREDELIVGPILTRCVHASVLGATILALCSCSSSDHEVHDEVGTSRASVIYGLDGRREPHETDEPELRGRAESTAVAMMESSSIVEMDGHVQVRAPSLGEAQNLCPTERFAGQPSAALCSGLLVGPDLVLTAGHCVRDWPCDEIRLVTRFFYDAAALLSALTTNDVYRCREVVTSEHSAPTETPRLDYGFIRLDRAVAGYVDREIAVRAPSWPLNAGEPVALFGFPTGIPLKIDTSGEVTDPRGESLDYFVSNSDSFEGNSGSPVFDGAGQLIGIQNRGAPDYVPSASGCNVENHLSAAPEAGKEKSTYAFRALAGLCAKVPEEPFCCANGSGCHPAAAASGGCALSRPAAHWNVVWTILLTLGLLGARPMRHKRRSSITRSDAPSACNAETGG